ncbi:MAG: hypothetical protein IPK83_14080 [Planctomycetes bacterium]|nr:hypothetical protein [Planctomycetota bacterium]
MRDSEEGRMHEGAWNPPWDPPAMDEQSAESALRLACVYRAYHRAIWPRLLCTPWAGSLAVESEDSWRELWGRIGREFYRCFAFGDRNIRRDMILRALGAGADDLAAKLDQWRLTLEIDTDR